MAQSNGFSLLSLITLLLSFQLSLARSINWYERRHHSTALAVRDIRHGGLSKREPFTLSFSTSSKTSARVSISVGGSGNSATDTNNVKTISQCKNSKTLKKICGMVSLSEVKRLVDDTAASTCSSSGTKGVVTFKAETSETENSFRISTKCSVSSKTIDGIHVAAPVVEACKDTLLRGTYYDFVLKTWVRKIFDCKLGLEALVYNDPEIDREVTLYIKGDFTIRRFYVADPFYVSNAYFVACATNGDGAELAKRGFFKGNAKDPIWDCAVPNADTVGGPRDSFQFIPANIGQCLVIVASRECLLHDSVAFFWTEEATPAKL